MQPGPPSRRPRKRSLPLRALALSLGLHAAAAAAYGGYHLGGLGDRPPRIAFADSGFVAITLRVEPGASGGHAAGEHAGGGADGQVAAVLPLIAAAAPAFATATRAVGRGLQDLIAASLQSAEVPSAIEPTLQESIEPVSEIASAPIADARDASGAAGVDGPDGAAESSSDVGSGIGGTSDTGAVAAAPGLVGDGNGDGAGIGALGSGSGPSEGEGPGGHEGHAGTRGLGDGHHPPPDYPQEARHAGQEGVVIVRALTDADGAVEDVLIEQSSGFPLLDDAALDAVRRWTFEPELDDGVAVASYVLCPIRFTLRR